LKNSQLAAARPKGLGDGAQGRGKCLDLSAMQVKHLRYGQNAIRDFSGSPAGGPLVRRLRNFIAPLFDWHCGRRLSQSGKKRNGLQTGRERPGPDLRCVSAASELRRELLCSLDFYHPPEEGLGIVQYQD